MLQNFDRLKVFFHVFSGKSIVAAANKLHVSQSAVSQTIAKLEDEIDTPLFIRLHKQLVPTTAGKQLYAIVHPFMSDLSSYLDSLEKAQDHPHGELRIGGPPEFGKAYFPAIVAKFRQQYQNVTFTLKFGGPETLLPLLRRGHIDFGLVDLFLAKNMIIGNLDLYHFEPILDEEIILACSKKYYHSRLQDTLSYEILSKQDFISYKKDSKTVLQWFAHHYGGRAPHIQNVLTVDSHVAVISAIKHNAGLGIVSAHLVQNELLNDEIVRIQTGTPDIINPISFVYLQDKKPTFTEKFFEKYLVKKIKEMDF